MQALYEVEFHDLVESKWNILSETSRFSPAAESFTLERACAFGA
jgi:hypothetical protein